ncbi:GNAT family N-acetyltransferase [Nannocystis radixulma]|uniref:GNAT family protein n=1 Tax=Nannocystis radixulma TaxID=2995305 RepID=A0ABT5B4I4_9BACT|nr:GNAT family protein [Nannocystis radixulma]MDC0667971.1 GNAT family protein [Nannocystis radixulma]
MNLLLQPTTEADLAFIVARELDADTAPYILPWPEDRHRQAMADPDCAHLVAWDGARSRRLGFAILFGLASSHQSVELRRLASASRGEGVGRAMLRAIKARIFETTDTHRLWLDVKAGNARARHLYRSEGFVEEGVMRDCLREGARRESLVLMSVLRPEYLATVPGSASQH